ncbi:MAG: 5-(carboxyamino)imidazole ribonucleotide synthase [Trueperaceae bacterium]
MNAGADPRSAPVLPGACIGIVGGGQLGRMAAQAARRLGYRVAVWSDVADAPALPLADVAVVAPYADPEALERFVAAADVATVEFENLPVATLCAIEARRPLRPSAAVVAATQHRRREKEALAALDVPLARWRPVDGADDLDEALAAVGRPAILKTAGFGYDGKGQVSIPSEGDVPAAARALAAREPCVLEARVDLACEVSVVVARCLDGSMRAFPPFENAHADHVLDVTVVPASVAPETVARAEALALRVVAGLGLIGLGCVECFVATDGTVLVNEVAPRPHNSGHVTIEACRVDQFEQQVRAVCGLPLGDPALVRPGAMANLLGDLWRSGAPDWAAALTVPGVRLHLYGKREPRSGRKMGHLSAVAATTAEAADLVRTARARAARCGAADVPIDAVVG